MKFLTLSKPVKTVVKSYEKDAEGKTKKDDKGNEVVTSQREIKIANLEVPQYESLQEATQQAGSEENLLKAINKWVKDEAVAPVRLVGNKFSTEDSDDTVIAEGRALAKSVNPFTDRRGSSGNAQNKVLADQFRQLQEMQAKGVSAEDIMAFIRGGQI